MGRSHPLFCEHDVCLDPGDDSFGLTAQNCKACEDEMSKPWRDIVHKRNIAKEIEEGLTEIRDNPESLESTEFSKFIRDASPEEKERVFTKVIEDSIEMQNNGGDSSYYEIPPDCKTLQDIIVKQEMSFTQGNIFKACYRWDKKPDLEYNLNKIKWFAQDAFDRIYAERHPRNRDETGRSSD